jgi:hypothetical protein
MADAPSANPSAPECMFALFQRGTAKRHAVIAAEQPVDE